jgi:hypothetical protein
MTKIDSATRLVLILGCFLSGMAAIQATFDLVRDYRVFGFLNVAIIARVVMYVVIFLVLDRDLLGLSRRKD